MFPRSLHPVMRLAALVLLALGAGACRTQRYMEITTDPPGAEVRLDDRQVGRTPLRVPFEHYGTRRLSFYLPGYRTVSKPIRLRPPWYRRFPLDIVSEVLLPFGFVDRREIHEDLVQGEEVMELPSLRLVVERANALRQSGPEGPHDLPKAQPFNVPSGSSPTPEQEPRRDEEPPRP